MQFSKTEGESVLSKTTLIECYLCSLLAHTDVGFKILSKTTRFVSSRNVEASFHTGQIPCLPESLRCAIVVLPHSNLSSEKTGNVFTG